MSIEEIIKELQEMAGYCKPGVPLGQAIREAITLLRTLPEAQPNEELTEEELRRMVGKWVWVTVHYAHCDTSGWAFVCARGRLAYFEQMLDISGCGTKFVARRRPPKEANNER